MELMVKQAWDETSICSNCPVDLLVLVLVLVDDATVSAAVELVMLVFVVDNLLDVDSEEELPKAADEIALNALESDDESSLEIATDNVTVETTPFVFDPVAEAVIDGVSVEVREGIGSLILPDILSKL